MLTQEGTALSPAAQAFIDFVMSDAASAIISNEGLVQVR